MLSATEMVSDPGQKDISVCGVKNALEQLDEFTEYGRILTLVCAELVDEYSEKDRLGALYPIGTASAIELGCICPAGRGERSIGCELHGVRTGIFGFHLRLSRAIADTRKILGYNTDDEHITKAIEWVHETYLGRCGWLGVARSGDGVVVYVTNGYSKALYDFTHRQSDYPIAWRASEELPQYRYGVKITYKVLPPFTPLTL